METVLSRISRLSRRWLLPACLMAAIPHAAAEPLTLARALSLAEAHSPAMKAAGARQAGAAAALETAVAYPNPELEVASGVSRPRQTGGENGRNESMGLSQPVELPSLRASRRQGAEAGMAGSAAALEQVRLTLRTDVKQAFFEVMRRQEEARLAAENHALLVQIRNRVKLRVEVGESPRYELVKAEAEALAAESAVRSAELRVVGAKARLRALIGAPMPESFDLVPAPPLEADLPDLEALRREMLERLPLLRAAEAETRRAQARVEQERAHRLPQPTVKWAAERDPDMRQWRLGVALPLPLWNRREGPIGEAVAGLHQARAEVDQLRLGLTAELDQAYSRYQIARRQVETFESGLMKEAETALKVAEAAYRFGERNILDYLDAQRVLRATRLDFLNARYELQAALIDIERLRAAPLAGDMP